MDLRKAILLKKPLQDSSFCSLNNSNASIYESAAEDSDNSMYYSFTNNSIKDFDNSIEQNVQDPEISLTSEVDDKENTVIMKHIVDEHENIEEDVNKIGEDITTEIIKVEEKMEIDDSVIIIHDDVKEEVAGHSGLKVSDNKQIPVISNVIHKSEEIPSIIAEDPNENLFNPFTMTEINQSNHSPIESPENRSSIETEKVTKRKVQEVNKKSASKIPMRTHLYSPVQRRSLDKKSKIISKPIPRRTIYETRSTAVQKPKAPIIPPVQTKITVPKPLIHKCTFAGCFREFRTVKSLQDHLKMHKPSTSTATTSHSSHSSSSCKWCDKAFELNTALTSHMIEKCTKIPFNEKRKLLAQQEKSNQANDNKRKSVFVAPPVPKKRSPRRQTMNKSGIMITPKKTLKCECGKKFTDVLEFANHMIAHKYEGALKPKQA